VLSSALALYTSYRAINNSNAAGKTAAEAAAAATSNPPQTTPSPQATMPNIIVVQLATYLARNCTTAQEEINSYSNEFSVRPSLWLVQGNRAVVVGIQAPDLNAANALKEKAQALAKVPKFSKEDLQNAAVRTNPQWKRLNSCADVPT
jgi:hypothetical protein